MLEKYKQKRRFNQTPEPKGRSGIKKSSALRFVVQKHQARQLHYDFRLEAGGGLKSWAIPKGPSLKPSDKRLAMMVEDHPIEYQKFEGIIPKGNYGAGKVTIWDKGTYRALNLPGRKESEKYILAGIKKGQITIILKGKKLKGEFALIRLKKAGPKAWLMIKSKKPFPYAQKTS